LAIARAVAPIFSPICGWTRQMAGASPQPGRAACSAFDSGPLGPTPTGREPSKTGFGGAQAVGAGAGSASLRILSLSLLLKTSFPHRWRCYSPPNRFADISLTGRGVRGPIGEKHGED
jgi:hypothetical protein